MLNVMSVLSPVHANMDILQSKLFLLRLYQTLPKVKIFGHFVLRLSYAHDRKV